MKKLAIITTHAIQYQVPLWRALAARLDLDVQVFFASDFSVRGYKDAEFGVVVNWDVPLTEGYAHTFLSEDPNINSTEGFFSLRANSLERELRDFEPDCALICGYMSFFWLEVAWILRRLHIPIIMRAEVTEDSVARSQVKQRARSAALRVFYRRISRFLAIGENARRHYESKGVPKRKIGRSPYCVDSPMIENQVQEFGAQRDTLRVALGFNPDVTVFLFSGKLVPVKDPLTIAAALESMTSEEREHVALLVVGDGELRPEFEKRCHELLGERAVFVGFRNQSELGRFYAVADCLVLPSLRETWGLVVNEALQFGMPVIVSQTVGSQRDLVKEGETGYTFPRQDAQILKKRMLQIRKLLQQKRNLVFTECRQQSERYSLEEATQGLYDAVQIVTSRGKVSSL